MRNPAETTMISVFLHLQRLPLISIKAGDFPLKFRQIKVRKSATVGPTAAAPTALAAVATASTAAATAPVDTAAATADTALATVDTAATVTATAAAAAWSFYAPMITRSQPDVA